MWQNSSYSLTWARNEPKFSLHQVDPGQQLHPSDRGAIPGRSPVPETVAPQMQTRVPVDPERHPCRTGLGAGISSGCHKDNQSTGSVRRFRCNFSKCKLESLDSWTSLSNVLKAAYESTHGLPPLMCLAVHSARLHLMPCAHCAPAPAITLSHALSYHREVNDLPHIAQPLGMKPCLNPGPGLPGSALAVSQDSSGLSPEKNETRPGPCIQMLA